MFYSRSNGTACAIARKEDAKKVLEAFDKETARINAEVAVIDGKISAAGPADNAVAALVSLRQADQLQLQKNPPISIQPFLLARTHVLLACHVLWALHCHFHRSAIGGTPFPEIQATRADLVARLGEFS